VEGRARVANTQDSTSNSEWDIFCRLTRNRYVGRRGLFAAFEPAKSIRRGDAIGSRSLQSRQHTHYVARSVVESNIHYPTDSSLLNDGTRVLTRTMKKIEHKVGGLKRKVRNRMRSVSKRVIAIGQALRHTGAEGELKRKREYRQLVRLTRQILNDSRRVLQEVQALPSRRRSAVRGLGERLEGMSEQVRAVVRQTKARVFAGVTQFPGKLVSLFEPQTEIIRKGKASKPNEFGKLVQVQEAENQIITHYEVYAERPSDRHLLLPAVAAHQRKLGRVPKWVAADAGFYSQVNEEGAQALGVKYVSIPNRNTRSEERRRWEKQRWFKQGQKWRTGCEGRISVIKRRHGLARCRYRGLQGMRRWVGLGVIADNLINIGQYLTLVSA
jgi:IS5 family transposase